MVLCSCCAPSLVQQGHLVIKSVVPLPAVFLPFSSWLYDCQRKQLFSCLRRYEFGTYDPVAETATPYTAGFVPFYSYQALPPGDTVLYCCVYDMFGGTDVPCTSTTVTVNQPVTTVDVSSALDSMVDVDALYATAVSSACCPFCSAILILLPFCEICCLLYASLDVGSQAS